MTAKIFIITGEESGDRLGADLIRKARESSNDQAIEFRGIGGEHMREQGVHSLFPLEDIAVMGLTEVVPKLPLIFARMSETVKAIQQFEPDIVLSIDCPDFSLRVQKRIRRQLNLNTKQIHYVAPTVWAWREGRAKAVANYLDKILCLYPFEPEYFQKHGLAADFVGHPAAEIKRPQFDEQEIKKKYNLPVSQKLVGLYLGSRNGEIKRHAPLFAECLQILKTRGQAKDVHYIVPTFEKFLPDLKSHFSGFSGQITFLTDQNEKEAVMPALTSALCVNGTICLELALSMVPHITCYKANILTAIIARRLIKVEHMHLVNIFKDHGCLGPSESGPIVPEFVQNDAQPNEIANKLSKLIHSVEDQRKQKLMFEALHGTLQADSYGTSISQAVLNAVLNDSDS